MLNEDRILIRIGRNRSGQDAGEIDMEVAVQWVQELSAQDFEQLLRTLDAARQSCLDWRRPEGAEAPRHEGGKLDPALEAAMARWRQADAEVREVINRQAAVLEQHGRQLAAMAEMAGQWQGRLEQALATVAQGESPAASERSTELAMEINGLARRLALTEANVACVEADAVEIKRRLGVVQRNAGGARHGGTEARRHGDG